MRTDRVDVCGRPSTAVVAESFVERLLGVHSVGSGAQALIVPGSSVHGVGLRLPMWVVPVDELGFGTGGKLLAPNRFVCFAGAFAVVEFPDGAPCATAHRSHVVRWHR